MEPSRERDGDNLPSAATAADLALQWSRRANATETCISRTAPSPDVVASMEPSRERDGDETRKRRRGHACGGALQWSRRANATETYKIWSFERNLISLQWS